MNTKTSTPLTISEQEIAARAYEIFLKRGASHGHDLDDWLEAERELAAATAASEIEEPTKSRAVRA